jgi:hypothetical protein
MPPYRSNATGMRSSLRAGLLGLCALLAAALPSAAQTPTRAKPFPQLRGARQWGPFLVDLQFSIDNIGYDDNIYQAPEDQSDLPPELRVPEERDYTVRAGPEITAQIALGPRVVLTLHDKAAGEVYFSHSDLNSISNVLDAQFDILAGPVLLTSKGTWQTSYWRPTSEINRRVRQETLGFTQTARYFVTPAVDLVAGFRKEDFTFTNPDLLAGFYFDLDFDGTVDEDEILSIGQALDRTMDEVSGEIGWRTNSRLRWFVRYLDRDATFDYQSLGHDSNEKRRIVGIEFSDLGRISGRLAIGRSQVENNDPNSPYVPYDGGVSETQLVYKPTGATRFKANYDRNLVFSTYQNNLYYRETKYGLSLDSYLGAAWGVTAGGTIWVNAYPQPGTSGSLVGEKRRDEITDYFGGLLFRAKGGFEIGLRVGRRARDSNEPTAVARRSYITTTGSYVF